MMLQQGIQRRIRITLIYDAGSEIHWLRVNELVIGRVRSTLNVSSETEHQSTVISLSVFQPHYMQVPGDDRVHYQFEAAWDSSLHNSILLNRLTPGNENVYVTLSAYIELEKCCQPACFTKYLCLSIHSRESRPTAPRSFFSYFTGQQPRPEHDCCVGIYELSLRKTVERTPEHQGPVVDTSTVYVRGEENLRGWRPRRGSLITDHREQVNKLHMIEETEKARHILQVRQKILDQKKLERGVVRMPSDLELNKLSDEHKAMLAEKCVLLLMRGKTGAKEEMEESKPSSFDEEVALQSSLGSSFDTSLKKSLRATKKHGRLLASPPMCVPEVQERTHTKNNPISRKGYLEFFGEQDTSWHRNYVVSPPCY